jgi:hypothetical protein
MKHKFYSTAFKHIFLIVHILCFEGRSVNVAQRNYCCSLHVQRMEENRNPKKALYMNLEATRLRGISRSRWQDVVR